ncbi:hypothetical protein M569_12607 [Genlisea aurea]|uniref:Pentacotripeptide-repeat region of PRORP domain-containing protein n=1 Tax=Genlisea aurea TaxID=192259 RepID=S8CCL6_9LAMI|nr:hypothetical protein M569_12607 [Genlisea aurea]
MNNKVTKLVNHANLALLSLHLVENRCFYPRLSRSAVFSSFPGSRFQYSTRWGFCCRRRSFSISAAETFLEIFSSNDSIERMRSDIEDVKLDLTHESAVYVLKKLSKDPIRSSVFLKWAVEKNGFQPSCSVYSLMLRIYAANKNTLKDFWATIKEMKEKGYYIDEETFTTLLSLFRSSKMSNEATALRHFYSRLVQENAMDDEVKEVVDVVGGGDHWGEKVEAKLREMNIAVSDNLVLRILKQLRGQGCAVKAYRFFKWIESSSDFEHTTVTYNGVLRILCREESIDEFWNVFSEMNAAGFRLDIDTYVKVSRSFQKNAMFEDGVKLYEHMMDSPYKPSVSECNYLLQALSRHGSPDLGLIDRVIEKFVAGGNSLSKTLYDGIHRSLTRLGKFEEAEGIVEKMRENGFEPDNVTYSQLVFGLCKFDRFDEAAGVLESMEKWGCKPDIMTWTILIRGHFKGGETDKAMLHFARMMEKGFDPDADLLEAIVDELSKKSRAPDAFRLLVELAEKLKLRPWQSTFKNLIQQLLDGRRFEEAVRLLAMMKRQNYPPHCEPFVDYVSKFGSVDDALEFLSSLTVKEYPSISSYRHVFGAFLNENRHSEAKDLLFRCPHHVRKHPAVCSLFDPSI